MPQVARLPALSGTRSRWGSEPTQELDRFLNDLPFQPEKVIFWMEGNLLTATQLLGIEQPQRCAVGTVEVVPGFETKYVLGSSDGRGIDYLTVTGRYEPENVRSVFARLVEGLAPEYSRDLQVFVQAAAVPLVAAQ